MCANLNKLLTCAELQDAIIQCQSNEQLEKARDDLNKLSNDLQGELADMTNYNKEKYKSQVDALFKMIEGKKNSIGGADRFEFRGEPIMITKETHKPSEAEITLSEPYMQLLSNQKFVIDEMVNHLLIRSFKNCVIMNDHNSSSINIYDGSSSVLKLDITGTITLTNLVDSILILNCHQLRLHGLHNCLILTNISNEIIMENCLRLKFNNKVNINDFNFNFDKSANYEFVLPDENKLNWIEEEFNGDKLSDTIKTFLK